MIQGLRKTLRKTDLSALGSAFTTQGVIRSNRTSVGRPFLDMNGRVVLYLQKPRSYFLNGDGRLQAEKGNINIESLADAKYCEWYGGVFHASSKRTREDVADEKTSINKKRKTMRASDDGLQESSSATPHRRPKTSTGRNATSKQSSATLQKKLAVLKQNVAMSWQKQAISEQKLEDFLAEHAADDKLVKDQILATAKFRTHMIVAVTRQGTSISRNLDADGAELMLKIHEK